MTATILAFTFGKYVVSAGKGAESNTSLSLSATSVMAGDAVTLTAFVGGPGRSTPEGTVQFTAGSMNIGSAPTLLGRATVTTSSLTPGTYEVVASFTGQVGSTSSQSTPVALTVTQIPTTLALTANPVECGRGYAGDDHGDAGLSGDEPAAERNDDDQGRLDDDCNAGSGGWRGELHDEHAGCGDALVECEL